MAQLQLLSYYLLQRLALFLESLLQLLILPRRLLRLTSRIITAAMVNMEIMQAVAAVVVLLDWD
jgi:hypothetical protein